MAEGVLLLLIYPETKKREHYQKLDKKYEFTALFGISSDSYDILGFPEIHSGHSTIDKGQLTEILKSMTGSLTQTLPRYSSYRIKGKPLFWWALQNKLNNIKLPQKQVTIFNIRLKSLGNIDSVKLESTILERLTKVKGNFRQQETLLRWKNIFRETKLSTFQTAKFEIHCSSGTYIRSIVNEIGLESEVGALTLNLKRISVGNYTYQNSVYL